MNSPRKSSVKPKVDSRRGSKASTGGGTSGQTQIMSAAENAVNESLPSVPTQSMVQEADGSFFESFTALSWKQKNRRLQTVRKDETQHEGIPPKEHTLDIQRPEFSFKQRERELLYVEVMYTIQHKLGATTGNYSPYAGDLLDYARDAFRMSHDNHRRLLAIAQEEKPPILVLNVVVVESRGLEAKDPNGFSDPYCMLGIQPERKPTSPLSCTLNSDFDDQNSKKGNLGRFRASFKRKGSKKERCDSGGNDTLPAKFIRVTSVKPHTLYPKWNEKFRFDIEDGSTDILHLDIWDHDDESSVLDAAKKLNEVSGLKGLGRFFKQVAQSARTSIGDSVDDFLGCVNIALRDIPSTGVDGWYELEGRSHRSKIQGSIRLKLHLGTREDRGYSEEEDSWNEFWQHYSLIWVFVEYEQSRFRGDLSQWDGRMSPDASTILHQHAIQGDLTELQQAMCRWIVFSRKHMEVSLDYSLLYRMLSDIDDLWESAPLTREEEGSLAESFIAFIDYCLSLIDNIRDLYNPNNKMSWYKLDSMLKCLCLIRDMKAYTWCCPFHKELHTEVTAAIKKGTSDWYEKIYELTKPHDKNGEMIHQSLIELVNMLTADMDKNVQHYNQMFDGVVPLSYASLVFRLLEKKLKEDFIHVVREESFENISASVEMICKRISSLDIAEEETIPDNIKIGTSSFELYLAIKDFLSYREQLLENDKKGAKMNKYYEWFQPVVLQWLAIARVKIMQRIRKAIQLDKVNAADTMVKHSTSSLDTNTCFYQVKEFWKMLSWPDVQGSYEFVSKVIDNICNGAMFYAHVTHQKLQEAGYYDEEGQFDVTDQLCITANNIENVRQGLKPLADELEFEKILHAVEKSKGDRAAQRCRASLYGMIHSTEADITSKIQKIVHKVGFRMQPDIKKYVFHLAWAPEVVSADDAIVPLMKYLDSNLMTLHNFLLQVNFDRMLQAMWDVVISEFCKTAHTNLSEKQTEFFKRLHTALGILVNFFHAGGKGMSLPSIYGPTYQALERLLKLHMSDTSDLLEMFYLQRFKEQKNQKGENGLLTVRIHFNRGAESLGIDVVNARDILPLDPNGFSDPFVIIELLPRHLFPHSVVQQTRIHKKTLNPNFDESFEFALTKDQCKNEVAMIRFTVMDHDFMLSNDYAGEAYILLSTVPGLEEDHQKKFKHKEMVLIRPNDKNNDIAQVLENRTWDKDAVEFMKQQKQRRI